MIAATAGTTNAGMIDPLLDCGALARATNIWFHVDAAWGGALIVSDSLRSHLAGLEQADSFTLDAHKWLGATMGCGMFVTKHAALLPDVFRVKAGFMPVSANRLDDPYTTSMQWSRRFLGLRLFLSLAAAGWNGYARHIEQAISHANLLRRLLVDRGWRIANRSNLAVLCVQPPGGSPAPETIVRRVLASQKAWISMAQFEGEDVVRICITNGRTGRADVVAVADALQDALADNEIHAAEDLSARPIASYG
jgi:glutamate/tyrosine decarboxylase-like PLP-dependent enzyme